jgi:hypothetical protein
MDTNVKTSYLKDEYLLLQKFYEDYDSRVVTIKGWSATIGLAAIGGGFYQSSYPWLFASVVSLICWILESIWKSFQSMFGSRISLIEKAFRDDDFSAISPLQIYTSWFDTLKERGFHIFYFFKSGIVVFPHAAIVLVGIVLFILNETGLIKLAQK